MSGGLLRTYGQECADPSGADVLEIDNNSDDNGSDDNGSGDNAAIPEVRLYTQALSCDAGEAVVGGQPAAGDTARAELDAGTATFLSSDGAVAVRWVGGGALRVTYDPVDLGLTPGPSLPLGVRPLRVANLRLEPLEDSATVDITMPYADVDLGGMPEAGIRMLYYSVQATAWLDTPAILDVGANRVTWVGSDLGTFGHRLTRVALVLPTYSQGGAPLVPVGAVQDAPVYIGAAESAPTEVTAMPTSLPAPVVTPTPEPPATETTGISGFDPSIYLEDGDRFNCEDFATPEQAQAVLDADSGDPNRLDGDGDGRACN